MQWADTSLLDFVDYLLEWSREPPPLRPHPGAPRARRPTHPTWGAGKRNFTSIYLEPLAAQAMRELARRACARVADEMREQDPEPREGVPLYAVETVRMLLDRGLLTRWRSVIGPPGRSTTSAVPQRPARADRGAPGRAPAEERAPLQDAAVLGKTLHAPALAALTGLAGGRIWKPSPRWCARRSSPSRPTRSRPSGASTASCRTSSGPSPTRPSPSATGRRSTSAVAADLEAGGRDERRDRRGGRVALPRGLRLAPDDPDAPEVKATSARHGRPRPASGPPSLAASEGAEGYFQQALS